MGIENFKFVSPGVEFVEIDNTQRPDYGVGTGPMFVGRAEHGPIGIPVTIRSAEEFVNVFGLPISGTKGGDVWRQGMVQSPTYAVYAAMAWLKNNTPCTFMRLGGEEHPERVDNAGEAGWKTSYLTYTDGGGVAQGTNGGAYGLFIGDKTPVKAGNVTFGGPGLNDMSVVGVYTGSQNHVPSFQIVAVAPAVVGGPDRFTWSLNGSAPATLTMTGAYQELTDGIYVKFAATTGHTPLNTWDFLIERYDELTLAAKFYVADGALTLTGTGIDTAPGAIDNSGVTGLDDMTIPAAQIYTGPGYPTYMVRVLDGVAVPNTYEFSYDGGVTWIAGGNMLAGLPVELNYGLTVQFAANAGHTTGDVWAFTVQQGTEHSTAAACLVASAGSNYEFKMKVYDENFSDPTGTLQPDQQIATVRFNFEPASTNYLRKVFSANPTLTNTDITEAANVKPYWLGESYDQSLANKLIQTSAVGAQFACLLKIEASGGTNVVGQGSDYRYPVTPSRTGWVFAQDFDDDYTMYNPDNMQKLFRFWSLNDGEWVQKNLKISINNIRYSGTSADPYGRFDLEIRSAGDSDKRPTMVERFPNCSLDPNSVDYIGKKIGTKYLEYNATTKRYVNRGKYPNQSKYFRVEIDNAVETASVNPYSLPFGFYGPTAFADITVADGAINFANDNWVRGGDVATTFIPFSTSTTLDDIDHDSVASFYATLTDVSNKLREVSTEESVTLAKQAYWGVSASRSGSFRYDASFEDMARNKSIMGTGREGSETGFKYSFIFSLDDVRYEVSNTGVTNTAVGTYDSRRIVGRATGQSITAGEETDNVGVSLGNTPDYKLVIDAGMARFTMGLWGGHDGLDITEKDPFRNERLGKNSSDPTRNYAVYSIIRALDTITDKDLVQYNMLVVPGITNQSINNTIVATVEARQDAFALLDIGGQYVPEHENYLAEQYRIGSVDETIRELQSYDFNTSWAGAPFNWVQIVDFWNNNNNVWLPPTVAAIDVLSMSQKISGWPWFSPAGYTRGNLSSRNAALRYVDVRFTLTQDDRDALSIAHLNPIVNFPEGILMMNDQTLYFVEGSILQLIGVRRAVIYVKDELKKIASVVLFDPNLEITWNRFVDPASRFLSGVQSKQGLRKFKLVMDRSINTPDVIDRNVMLCKIDLTFARPGKNFGITLALSNEGVDFAEV